MNSAGIAGTKQALKFEKSEIRISKFLASPERLPPPQSSRFDGRRWVAQAGETNVHGQEKFKCQNLNVKGMPQWLHVKIFSLIDFAI